MKFQNLSDPQLLAATHSAATREKQATLELLEHLLEVDRRDLALREGFQSLWDYVHRGLGYSESAASERVAAMRLLKRAPEAAQMIREEKLTLTVAAKLQHFVRAVERTEARSVSVQETTKLLAEVAGKSKREVEKLFVAKSPEAVVVRETVRPVSEQLTELRVGMDQEFLELLNEAKELGGTANHAETLKRALKKFVAERKKELGRRKPDASDESAIPAALPSRSRYIPRHERRVVRARAHNQCEYVAHNGARCTSNHKLQMDHIRPLAAGGLTELSNLRLLCQNHNLAAAREWGLLWKAPSDGMCSDYDSIVVSPRKDRRER